MYWKKWSLPVLPSLRLLLHLARSLPCWGFRRQTGTFTSLGWMTLQATATALLLELLVSRIQVFPETLPGALIITSISLQASNCSDLSSISSTWVMTLDSSLVPKLESLLRCVDQALLAVAPGNVISGWHQVVMSVITACWPNTLQSAFSSTSAQPYVVTGSLLAPTSFCPP